MAAYIKVLPYPILAYLVSNRCQPNSNGAGEWGIERCEREKEVLVQRKECEVVMNVRDGSRAQFCSREGSRVDVCRRLEAGAVHLLSSFVIVVRKVAAAYNSSLTLCVASVATLEALLTASPAVLEALAYISLIRELAASTASAILLLALSMAPCSGP